MADTDKLLTRGQEVWIDGRRATFSAFYREGTALVVFSGEGTRRVVGLEKLRLQPPAATDQSSSNSGSQHASQ
jgi:hypothetical protein